MATARVKSVTTRRFWELFQALPPEVQSLAVKNYHLWRRDPRHPSLRFRRLQGSEDRFSIRVGDHYRALGAFPVQEGYFRARPHPGRATILPMNATQTADCCLCRLLKL